MAIAIGRNFQLTFIENVIPPLPAVSQILDLIAWHRMAMLIGAAFVCIKPMCEDHDKPNHCAIVHMVSDQPYCAASLMLMSKITSTASQNTSMSQASIIVIQNSRSDIQCPSNVMINRIVANIRQRAATIKHA